MFENLEHNKKVFLYVLIGIVGVMFLVVAIIIVVGILKNEDISLPGGNGDGGNGGGNGGGGGLTGFFARFTGYTPDETGDIYYLGGKVGIGTSTPNYLLEVEGNFDAQSITINGTSIGGIYWQKSNATDELYYLGDVGIGTISPDYKLEVDGSFDAEAISINGVPVSTSSGSYWSMQSNNIYYTTGNVGIGTSSPLLKLHVAGPAYIGSDGKEGIKINISTIEAVDIPGGPSMQQVNLYLNAKDNIIIGNSTKKIGIGTLDPTETLDVGGKLKVRALDLGDGVGGTLCVNNAGVLCLCGKCGIPTSEN